MDGRGFEFHPRQFFSLKNNCLGQVVLCCFVFLLCCVALPCFSKHLMDVNIKIMYIPRSFVDLLQKTWPDDYLRN